MTENELADDIITAYTNEVLLSLHDSPHTNAIIMVFNSEFDQDILVRDLNDIDGEFQSNSVSLSVNNEQINIVTVYFCSKEILFFIALKHGDLIRYNLNRSDHANIDDWMSVLSSISHNLSDNAIDILVELYPRSNATYKRIETRRIILAKRATIVCQVIDGLAFVGAIAAIGYLFL